jgi:hypothetical protein
MMAPSMTVSSWWRNWWSSHWCCTNSQRVHRGSLLVGKTHKGSIWRVEFIIIMIIIFCEVHKIGWILAHRVCRFLNMQLPIKVKLN